MKLKILLFLFISQIFITAQIDTTVYFPLEIGNRWDFKTGEWIPSGLPVSYDTLVYKITTDTLMSNGNKYFKIDPGYVNYKDFIRADSIGIYFYDIKYKNTSSDVRTLLRGKYKIIQAVTDEA